MLRQEEEKKTILRHTFWNWVIQHQTHPICDFDGQSLLSLQVHCLPPFKHTSLQGLQCSERKKRKRRYSNTLFGIEWYNTSPVLFVTLTDNLCYLCKYASYHLLNTHHCRAYSTLTEPSSWQAEEKRIILTRFLKLVTRSIAYDWSTLYLLQAENSTTELEEKTHNYNHLYYGVTSKREFVTWLVLQLANIKGWLHLHKKKWWGGKVPKYWL